MNKQENKEAFVKSLGFRKKWLSDKSGFWYESKIFKYKNIKLKITIDDKDGYICVGAFWLLAYKSYSAVSENIIIERYSKSKLKQIIRDFNYRK